MRKTHILVSWDADEGAAVSRLVSPHLRLEVIHADRRARLRITLLGLRRVSGGEDFRLRHHLHVVVDLVVQIEVRRPPRDRVLAIREIQRHLPLQPFRLPEFPRATDDCLEPIMIARNRPAMDRHHSAAAFQVFLEALPLLPLNVPRLRRMENDDIRFCQLILRGKSIASRGLRPVSIEERSPVLEECGIVVAARRMGLFPGADEDAKRFSSDETEAKEEQREYSHIRLT